MIPFNREKRVLTAYLHFYMYRCLFLHYRYMSAREIGEIPAAVCTYPLKD